MKRRGAQQHHRLAANICLVSYRRTVFSQAEGSTHYAKETGNFAFCVAQQVALLVKHVDMHWISLSTWDLGPEEIRAISDFAL